MPCLIFVLNYDFWIWYNVKNWNMLPSFSIREGKTKRYVRCWDRFRRLLTSIIDPSPSPPNPRHSRSQASTHAPSITTHAVLQHILRDLFLFSIPREQCPANHYSKFSMWFRKSLLLLCFIMIIMQLII